MTALVANWLVYKLSGDWSTNKLIGSLNDWQTGWPADWLTG